MAAAETVIVGGGVVGASTAFHLAKRTAGRIIVVERNTAGAGPTSKTIGIVRLHYSYEPLIRLASRGLEFFQNFEAHTGATADFSRTGFLLLARPDQLPGVEANVALQQRLGVDGRDKRGHDATDNRQNLRPFFAGDASRGDRGRRRYGGLRFLRKEPAPRRS